MSANLDDLVPELAPAARQLVDAAGAAGLMPKITSTLRSRSEQTRLYRRSQQGLQHYPVAPPGMSAHEYGWAFDLIVSPFDAIYDVAYTWQQWGGGWNQADAVHFELPGASEEAKRLGQQQPDTSSFVGYLGAETQGVIDFIKVNAPTALEISSLFNLPLGIATTLWQLFSPKK